MIDKIIIKLKLGLYAIMVYVVLTISDFVGFILGLGLAYISGWIASLTVGNILASGLNTLFNVSYFTKDMLPICVVVLHWLGSFYTRPLNEKDKELIDKIRRGWNDIKTAADGQNDSDESE